VHLAFETKEADGQCSRLPALSSFWSDVLLTLLVCAARRFSVGSCFCLGIVIVMTIRPSLLLASDYYASILIPMLFRLDSI
jgi:hypothetical protein